MGGRTRARPLSSHKPPSRCSENTRKPVQGCAPATSTASRVRGAAGGSHRHQLLQSANHSSLTRSYTRLRSTGSHDIAPGQI